MEDVHGFSPLFAIIHHDSPLFIIIHHYSPLFTIIHHHLPSLPPYDPMDFHSLSWIFPDFPIYVPIFSHIFPYFPLEKHGCSRLFPWKNLGKDISIPTRSHHQGAADEARQTYLATALRRRKTSAELTALLRSAKTARKV